MVKKFSISVPDYVWQKYFKKYKGNLSKYIEEHFIAGVEMAAGEQKDYKVRHLKALQELREKDEEIHKLNKKLEQIEKRSTDGGLPLAEGAERCNVCKQVHGMGHRWQTVKGKRVCYNCFLMGHY